MTDKEEARGEARGDHVSAVVMRRWARLIVTPKALIGRIIQSN